MNNNEPQLEDLENLTTEELEALVADDDSTGKQDDKSGKQDDKDTTDWKAKALEAEKRAGLYKRLLGKKDKNQTTSKPNESNNSQAQLSQEDRKDIEDLKFMKKVETFAEENGLTKAQAQQVLKLNPNATADTLKDPFFAEGIKAIGRKERVEDNTPGTGKKTTVGGKSFKEMTREERIANFEKFTQ